MRLYSENARNIPLFAPEQAEHRKADRQSAHRPSLTFIASHPDHAAVLGSGVRERLSKLEFPVCLSVTATQGTRQVVVVVHPLKARCPTALRWIRRDKHDRASGTIQAALRRVARRASDMDSSSSPSVDELLGTPHRYIGSLAIQGPLVASVDAY